jgi:hypothetical protein
LLTKLFYYPRAFCVRSGLRELELENGTFPSLESYVYRSHDAYIAGISLWTVWTACPAEALESM